MASVMSQKPIADFGKMKSILQKAKNIVVLTGAGVSAESGIPTFRGAGGFWRSYQATDLATPGAFKRNPSLVWEFYHYRRETAFTKQPNKAHLAIAEAEKKIAAEKADRKFTVVTQNIDGLHERAGSRNIIELHGSLYRTQCLKCQKISINKDSPICPALEGKGVPDPDAMDSDIPEADLPRCKDKSCGGLLRPDIIWFGESLKPDILEKTDKVMSECDACLVVGTSCVVYPAAMYAPELAARGVPVAEFNIEKTPASDEFMFHFSGPCGETLPKVLQGITAKSSSDNSASQKLENSPPNESKPTNSGDDEGNEPKKEEKLSGAQKLKQAVQHYGSTVIVFHIGISLCSLGAFYAAFSSGLDMNWMLSSLNLEGKLGSVASGASTFVLAYAVHKVFAPVRITITLGATPFIVRYLRAKGILSAPKPGAAVTNTKENANK